MSRTAEMLNLPHDAIAQLCDLRAAPKFEPTPPFYTGIKDNTERQSSEATINALIDKIAGGIESHPTGKFVLEEFSAALAEFDQVRDKEDREQVCTYLENIMEIVGLKSSDGLLNTWLYGFDPSPKRS